MFKTKEEFVRAVEKSMTRHASQEHDRHYDQLVRFGRYCYREFSNDLTRHAGSTEAIDLEGYIKRCLAIDFFIAKRNGRKLPADLEALGKLFDVTPEYTAKEEKLYDAEYLAA